LFQAIIPRDWKDCMVQHRLNPKYKFFKKYYSQRNVLHNLLWDVDRLKTIPSDKIPSKMIKSRVEVARAAQKKN